MELEIKIEASDYIDIKRLERDIKNCNRALKGLAFLNLITFGLLRYRFEYQAEILCNHLNNSIELGDYNI